MKVERLESGGVRVATTCKLNLHLDVLGRRGDGYHELLTLFHEIAWGDEIALRLRAGPAGDVRLLTRGRTVPQGEENLCVRAARELLRAPWASAPGAIEIQLDKRVPPGSGLGGGSADAVAVLLALAELLEISAQRRVELAPMSASLGSDCPFFLMGGTCIGRGRGELLQRISPPALAGGGLFFCLALPSQSVSTAAVFQQLARDGRLSPAAASFQRLLRCADSIQLAGACHNRLEEVSFELHPELRVLRDELALAWGRRPCLSGSGAALFTPFDSEDEARAALEEGRRARSAVPQFVVASAPAPGGGSGS